MPANTLDRLPPTRRWVSLPSADLARHRREIDEQGFTLVHGVGDRGWLARVGERIDELLRQEGSAAGSEFSQEEGAARLSDLANKGEVFDRTWLDPWLHDLVGHVVGPFKFSSLNFRESLPGTGHQELHPDAPDLDCLAVNSIWAVDEFTADNGATRVVPGSHRVPRSAMPSDRRAVHPREIVIACPAGSVIVYDVRLWHSATLNRSGARRRALHAVFCQRHVPQQLDQRRYLRPETRARLPIEALRLLDAE
jgi:ectoine hydroxylase-related dioxygenase (phytanoyl-CoA dioxygenase family)